MRSPTKAELNFLERVFAQEIMGGMLQSKSKMAKQLEQYGYIQEIEKSFGHDRFGAITAKGYILTILGNATYCFSVDDPKTKG
jgi:hypothetical protein